MKFLKQALITAIAFTAALLLPSIVFAFPDRPVRIIVAYLQSVYTIIRSTETMPTEQSHDAALPTTELCWTLSPLYI